MIALPQVANPSSADRSAAVTSWLRKLSPEIQHQVVETCGSQLLSASASQAKQKRQQEFARGRASAAKLLLGFDVNERVEANKDRSPKWPAGIVGSISHSKRWTWVAAAREAAIRSVGVDTETVASPGVCGSIEMQIASHDEWANATLDGLSREQTFTIVFSAKEAFYKCWYPQSKVFFDFDAAHVQFVTADRIRIRSRQSHPNYGQPPAFLDVHYQIIDQDVFTFTWMERN